MIACTLLDYDPTNGFRFELRKIMTITTFVAYDLEGGLKYDHITGGDRQIIISLCADQISTKSHNCRGDCAVWFYFFLWNAVTERISTCNILNPNQL